MIGLSNDAGWGWFEPPAPSREADQEELCRAFARCFAGPDGRRVTEHLERLILDRRLLPSARDAELWHAEGQRSAVAYILNMAARGRD